MQNFSGDYCIGIPGTELDYFSWQYQDSTPYGETQFELQIDDNSNFSSPEVDHIVDATGYLSGNWNQQIINVLEDSPSNYCDANNLSQPLIVLQPGSSNLCDHITYNVPYYFRVRVWSTCSVSGWYYNDYSAPNYTTINQGQAMANAYDYSHPAPIINYIFSPSAPKINNNVSFTDGSTCYNNNGTSYSCANGSGTLYFWNFGDGSLVNTNKTNISHSYSSAGSYNTYLELCDGQGCCISPKLLNVSSGNGNSPIWKEISPF